MNFEETKGETIMKTTLRSQELSCPSCVAKIEKALKGMKGVSEAKVYFNSGRIEIEHDHEKASPDDLINKVRSVGYEARKSTF
jgi:copper chaperone